MINIATWNSRGGLGDTNDSGKAAFLNSVDADLVIVSDYGVGTPTQKLIATNSKWAERILVSCRSGTLRSELQTDETLPTFLPVTYVDKESREYNILAVYAGTPLPKAYRSLNRTLTKWTKWLSERPSFIVGDLNIWVNLKDDCDRRGSRDLLARLEAMHFSSAYHALKRCEYGAENEMTYQDYQSDTHIDLYFFPI